MANKRVMNWKVVRQVVRQVVRLTAKAVLMRF